LVSASTISAPASPSALKASAPVAMTSSPSCYRRDHLRALAQRVEVAEGEVRIMGSKSRHAV
jgi:hypothetical protein